MKERVAGGRIGGGVACVVCGACDLGSSLFWVWLRCGSVLLGQSSPVKRSALHVGTKSFVGV